MNVFNLKEAIAGKPLQTVDGREVSEFVYFNDVKGKYCCYAQVDGEVISFTKEGKSSGAGNSPRDLVMKTQTVTKWMNVYAEGDLFVVGRLALYDSKAEALAVSDDALATRSVKFEYK